MRTLAAFFFILCLTACKHGPDDAAIREGVIDRLSKAGMNVAAMNVNVQSLEQNGNRAEVTVAITLKAAPEAQATVMRYRMEQQGAKWVVVGREDGAASPHGGGAPAPGMANPHGGAAPEGGRMPSPEDLPPAGKRK